MLLWVWVAFLVYGVVAQTRCMCITDPTLEADAQVNDGTVRDTAHTKEVMTRHRTIHSGTTMSIPLLSMGGVSSTVIWPNHSKIKLLMLF